MRIIVSGSDWLVDLVKKQNIGYEINRLAETLNCKKHSITLVEMNLSDLKKIDSNAPDWVLASVRGENDIILLSSLKLKDDDFIKKIILHEFVHISMIYLRDNCPLYIYEGIAMNLSGQIEKEVDLTSYTKFTHLEYNTPQFYRIAYNLIKVAIDIYTLQTLLKLIFNYEYEIIERKIIEVITQEKLR